MAETSWNGAAAGEFRIGAVLNRSFGILSRNLIAFCGLVGLCYLPLLFVMLSTATTVVVVGQMPNFTAIFLPLLLTMVLSMLSYAAVVHGAFQDMRGRKVDLGQSLSVGLGRVVPIFGLSLLIGLGVMLGMILLIVPGVILAISWYVAVPACVVEQLGPTASMGRSSALTKGHRWKVFGLLLIVGLSSAILSGVLGGVFMFAGVYVSVVVRFIVQVLVAAFGSILAVVTYHDLRVAKEGLDTDRIASVFD